MAASYYDVLNVPKDADNKVISDAYKKMALKWHPDKNPDNVEEANQRFQQISEAYQVLSDGNKRFKYDRGQRVDHQDCRNFYNYHNDDHDDEFDEFGLFFNFVSPEMLFRHFFRQKAFHAHNLFDDQRNSARNRKGKADDESYNGKHRGEDTCHIRTVNGKQWMTKTTYEDGKKIVSRYEDGDLISKQINGVNQKI